MMIYNSCCALVALGLLAGSVVAQKDYTIGAAGNANGAYTATVATVGGTATLTVTGTYPIVEAFGAAAYSQSFFTVSGANQCTTTPATPVNAVSVTASGTSLTLTASFSLALASLSAAVYTGPQATDNTATAIDETKTGVVLLCHTIQLKEGTLLMNEVKTIVKIELQLSATFTNAAITTVASSVLSGNTNLDLATGVTITPTLSPSQLRAGQPVTITLTASPGYKLSGIPSAILTGGTTTPTTVLPTPDSNVLQTNSCTGGVCKISLTLGFSFFTAPTTYTLSGTATLDLSSNRRRLESVSPPEEATFQVVLFAVPEDTQSSAGLTMVTAAAGGVMAVVAVVIL